MSIQGHKVVAAEEMARIEGLAHEAGSESDFMENAGKGIAELTEEFVLTHGLDKRITLFVGKGNNGGDAFAAGKRLIAKGFSVSAVHFYPLDVCSPLCKRQHEEYTKAGGTFSDRVEGVILDGLVGTGFHGKAENELAAAIERANNSKLPILAIDIPSGLDGNNGSVGSVAIQATWTIYLGLPKAGFFIGEGWNHVGELKFVDFGLPAKFTQEAQATFTLIDATDVASALPKIKRTRHKYQAGYVVAVAGSKGFSGAAFLATKAALRAGAGIVRLFYNWDMEPELAGAPLEIVKEEIESNGHWRILEEGQRAKALLLGPGMGRDKDSQKLLKQLLPRIDRPVVLDADALFFLAQNPSYQLPENAVLTPHRKEMERLLQLESCEDEKKLHTLCQEYVDKRQATLLLKGAPTFIFQAGQAPLISTRGDPGMASAGTGDVLTGIIAALLAQGLPPPMAAAAGATLHGMAGEIVAYQRGSRSLIASDLIEALGDAFQELLSE